MPADEIFPRPLVKSVIFAIDFPNLFFIQDRIGAFQVLIMRDFPESQLIIKRQFVITEDSSESKRDEVAAELKNQGGTNTWQFLSPDKGVALELSSSRLTLSSNRHKTYSLGDEGRFRDVIESACQAFFEVTEVPIINRIGLRYIDDCPILGDTTKSFRDCYNAPFDLERFPLEKTIELDFKVVRDFETHRVRHVKSLRGASPDRKLILDVDAWASRIDPADTLGTADMLHDAIWDEFAATVKEPIFEYMRTPVEETQEQ